LPFKKNGKIIPHAFVDCECKLVIPERFDNVRPDVSDFDFPMSDTFRGFSFGYCNQPDLGYVPLDPEAKPQEIFHYHVDLSKKILQNLEGQVKYLQGKVMEKQVKRPKPSGYKGIK